MKSVFLVVALVASAGASKDTLRRAAKQPDGMDTMHKRMVLTMAAHERAHMLPDMFGPRRSGRDRPSAEDRKAAREQARAEQEAYETELRVATPEKIDELYAAHEAEIAETNEMYEWWCADHGRSLGCIRHDMDLLEQADHRPPPPPSRDERPGEDARAARVAERESSRQKRKDLRDELVEASTAQRGDKRGKDDDEYAEMHEAWCARKGNADKRPCVAWKTQSDGFRRGMRGGKYPLKF